MFGIPDAEMGQSVNVVVEPRRASRLRPISVRNCWRSCARGSQASWFHACWSSPPASPAPPPAS
nr:hypothetical protein [Pseudorhodoferax sp. Leaf265]